LFEIRFSNDKAKKQYDNLDEKMKQRVAELFKIVRETPVPFRLYDVRKLAGFKNSFRIRLGKFRIKYYIDETEHKIYIINVELRDEATYKK